MNKETILNTAVKMARKIGYQNVTRHRLARRLNIAPSHVSYYFGGMQNLRDTIMLTAVKEGIESIIAMGLLLKDPIAIKTNLKIKIEG